MLISQLIFFVFGQTEIQCLGGSAKMCFCYWPLLGTFRIKTVDTTPLFCTEYLYNLVGN